jgi:hypothetical protein
LNQLRVIDSAVPVPVGSQRTRKHSCMLLSLCGHSADRQGFDEHDIGVDTYIPVGSDRLPTTGAYISTIGTPGRTAAPPTTRALSSCSAAPCARRHPVFYLVFIICSVSFIQYQHLVSTIVGHLITLFSVTNYCRSANAGAYVRSVAIRLYYKHLVSLHSKYNQVISGLVIC